MAANGTQWDGRVSAKHYAVACLDILGQRAEFGKLSGFLKNGTTVEDAMPVLQRTYGRLHKLRTDFEEQFGLWNKLLAGREGADAMGAPYAPNPVATYSFADTVVAFMRFGPEPANCFGVTGIVLSSAMMLIWMLANGIPIRGAVDVHWASPIGEKEVYGPALIEAHRLESDVAGYPRVVLGKGLLEYLKWATGQDKVPKAVACVTNCLKFVFTDHDGQPAIDHLGPMMKNFAEESSDWVGLARRAAAFVKSQQARFATSGDAKLAARYTVALRYCNSRSVLWGNPGHSDTVTTKQERRPTEEQGAVYDAASKFLFGRDVKLREMSYDWASGLLRFGASRAVDPSTVRDLQAHLVAQGFLVSSVISEPHKV
jgi:hypothetical protein